MTLLVDDFPPLVRRARVDICNRFEMPHIECVERNAESSRDGGDQAIHDADSVAQPVVGEPLERTRGVTRLQVLNRERLQLFPDARLFGTVAGTLKQLH
jgi:hypothetical protein